ncbi:MAG: UbiA family prenyltransferase [Nannocystaceae bacterium]|nr:UbiA family prenyltransferase [bacterium]
MRPELKIAADVAWYRLQRFEMANLGAAGVIAVALALSLGDLVVRVSFGALLNLLVYLNNDYLDVVEDGASPTKDAEKTRFLAEHRGAAVRSQLGMLALLLIIAWAWGDGLIWPLLFGGGICWAYSAFLKHWPFVDVLAMMVWGVAMPWVAVPPGSDAGWALLLQLGLFSGVFETIQVMRDHDEDGVAGVRTTAVVLGMERTRWLLRGLLLAAGLYAAVTFGWWLAVLPWSVLALRIPEGDLSPYWNRVRLLLGATLLIECALVYLGAASG